jgi:uncharacterized membrane protein YbaN (DUF454 family)
MDSVAHGLMEGDNITGLSSEKVVEIVLEEHKPTKNPIARVFWVISGSVFVVFAYIGTFVPGWPTVSWLVLAAFCYARSSKRMFKWLLTNPLFGKVLLKYYQNGKASPYHSKVLIIGMMDPLGIGRSALADAEWAGLAREMYLFIALFFFICCFI